MANESAQFPSRKFVYVLFGLLSLCGLPILPLPCLELSCLVLRCATACSPDFFSSGSPVLSLFLTPDNLLDGLGLFFLVLIWALPCLASQAEDDLGVTRLAGSVRSISILQAIPNSGSAPSSVIPIIKQCRNGTLSISALLFSPQISIYFVYPFVAMEPLVPSPVTPSVDDNADVDVPPACNSPEPEAKKRKIADENVIPRCELCKQRKVRLYTYFSC